MNLNSDTMMLAVLKALAKPEFKWRTIKGVAKETGLSPEIVMRIVRDASDKVVRASSPSPEGEALYTTREHFRERASIAEKVIGAIKNRAD